MPKKNCAMTGLLLSLALILGSTGLACSGEPATVPPPPSQPLMAPDPEIPANYTTYTDETKLFSIAYPPDWDLGLWLIPEVKKDTQEVINSMKTGSSIERQRVIFIAGIAATYYDTSASIVVDPIPEQIPKGVSALDKMVETELKGIEMVLPDRREFSRVKTTIDGREATIVHYEATPPESGKRHYLMMITLAGNTAWRLICSSTADDFFAWEKDFNAIVRSLRIYD